MSVTVRTAADVEERRRGARAAPLLTTLREGSLHAALKALYAGTGGRTETIVDGFVVDVERPDAIVEVQTASLGSIRRKLERLVRDHRVILVHPVAVERWLVRVGEGGELLGRRRSPKRGIPLDAFDQLVSVAGVLAHPNLALDLVLIREEEIRGPIPAGARYRYPRQWWRLDRRLVEVVDTVRFEGGVGLAGLLPPGLPEPFTSADVVAATRRSRRIAMRAVYTLEKAGEIRRVGRRGQYIAYAMTPGRGGRVRAGNMADGGPARDGGRALGAGVPRGRGHAQDAVGSGAPDRGERAQDAVGSGAPDRGEPARDADSAAVDRAAGAGARQSAAPTT